MPVCRLPPDWAREVNQSGMELCARLLPAAAGPFCFGDAPSLADILLIPQMANARRYGVDMVWDNLARIEANCLALPWVKQRSRWSTGFSRFLAAKTG